MMSAQFYDKHWILCTLSLSDECYFFAGSRDHKVDMPEIMTVWEIFFFLGQSSGTDRLTELCQCAYTCFPNTTVEWIKCARVMT